MFSRDVEHVPRIWGVSYIKVFAVIGIGLLITTVIYMLSSGGGGIAKIMSLVVGVLFTCALYGVCLWMERQGGIARRLPFLKRNWISVSQSRQTVQYKLK